MIEKIKRRKQIDNQDKQQPQTIQDLIRRYDLDNIEIKDYLDYLIGRLKEIQEGTEAEMKTKISNALSPSYKGNLNDLKTTCFIYADGNATNTPLKGYSFYVTVIALNNNYIIQKANRVSPTNFEEYQRQCSNGTWTEWRDMSAPVTVTNDNGTVTKFPDGTMICRKTVPKEEFATSQTNVTTVQGISIYRSGAYSWTYPVAFVDTNIQFSIQTATMLEGSRLAVGRVNGNHTKSGAQIQVLGLEGFLENEVGYTNLTRVFITAIGRWK